MTRAITFSFLVLMASVVAAEAPRVEVRTLPPAGAAAEDTATMEKIASLLSQAVSPELTPAPAPDTLTANAAACAEDLSYQKCLQSGATPWDPRSLMPPADGADAVVLFVFDRSSHGTSHRGVFYLVPRNGKWASAPFSVKVRNNRAEVRSPMAKLARAAGLDVPEAPAESSFSASALQ